MSVTLSGALPQGDGNGLAAIVADLTKDPRKRHVGVVILDAAKTVINNDTGDTVPTVRVRRIEIVTGDDVEPLRRLLERAFERRTGATTLPFDLEQDVRAAFDGIDPAAEQTTLDGDDGEPADTDTTTAEADAPPPGDQATCPYPGCDFPEGHEGEHPDPVPGADDDGGDAAPTG